SRDWSSDVCSSDLADLPGGQGVTFGGVPRALLMADEHVADLLGVEHRVVRRQDRTARNAEYGVDADRLERADEARCTRHRRPVVLGGLVLRHGRPLIRVKRVGGFIRTCRVSRNVVVATKNPSARRLTRGSASAGVPDALMKYENAETHEVTVPYGVTRSQGDRPLVSSCDTQVRIL